ncbi:MAG: hypothetical protein ACU83O_11845 [Gammaproteobacteria bacterium]
MPEKTTGFFNFSLRLSAIAAVSLLLFAACLCFRWSFANVLSLQVRHLLGKAQTIGQSLNTEQWRFTHQLMTKTLQLHPDYSDYLEMSKLFYQVADDRSDELPEELGWRGNEDKSLEYARRAVLARPSWPYYWQDLMTIKINLNQFDSELTGAMERAVHLGPWEAAVQYDVAYQGLEHWDRLPKSAYPWVIMAADKILLIENRSHPPINEMLAHPNFEKLCLEIQNIPNGKLKVLDDYCKKPLSD